MSRIAVSLTLLLASTVIGQTVETIPFRAVLSNANETPQPPSTTSGTATVWLHVVRDADGNVTSGSADALVSYDFSSAGTITAMHIHRGAAGVNGPVVVPFAVERTEVNGSGRLPVVQTPFPSTAVPVATISDILANPSQFYYNVHSTDFPAGIMRGQLRRAETIVRIGPMMPENETPPITDEPWSATGTVMLLMTRDDAGTPNSAYAIFDVIYRNFPVTNFTGLHIHSGAAQVSGPVTINSGLQGPVAVAEGGSGRLHYEAEVDLNRAGALETVEGLVSNPSGFYINLHTTEQPAGAVRSQMLRTDRMEFPLNLMTSNEVPPITDLDASAAGKIIVYTVRNPNGTAAAGAVQFDLNTTFPADTEFRGLHIHDAIAGVNGPVTIDSALATAPILFGTSGSGNISRLVTVGSGQALESLNSLLLNPSRHYGNLHTGTNPGGAVRAQLAPAGDLPTITSIQIAVAGSQPGRIAPGTMFAITGTSLANVATDVAGFNNLPGLPTTLNGVTVTIGGTTAPLTMVSPTEIRGQLPFDVAQGDRMVVVTTPNGASQAFVVSIVPSAPAILFGAGGVVAMRESDGTAITQRNPARPGDIIIISVIGLGQTVPQLAARIGGINSNVLRATAAPGSNTMHHVTVRVPQGLQTGNIPMVLVTGLITSNVVSLPVM
jgi:uncharacterized protein (TIGR03437 family)